MKGKTFHLSPYLALGFLSLLIFFKVWTGILLKMVCTLWFLKMEKVGRGNTLHDGGVGLSLDHQGVASLSDCR